MSRSRVWFIVKTLFGLAVIAGIGVHFYRILTDPALEGRFDSINTSLLWPAALLYPLCHTLWGTFWWQLLRQARQQVPWGRGVSTYFVSQFGKYVPGKVWVILLRMAMLHKYGTSRAVVFVTGIAESLTTVASGALLGVGALFAAGIVLPINPKMNWVFALMGIAPIASVLLFNFIQGMVRKRKPHRVMIFNMPPIPLLIQGMIQACVGWCLLAVSLGLVIRAVRPGEADFTGHEFLTNLAAVALSYVAGFVILVAPGGLGVREWVLAKLVMLRWIETDGPVIAEATAVMVAILLRLAWTIAEVGLAGFLWLRSRVRDHDTA